MSLANVTIQKADIVARLCSHCGAKTMQIGKSGNTCLQCIADGGGCCSLKAYDRWHTDGDPSKPLAEPRGRALR